MQAIKSGILLFYTICQLCVAHGLNTMDSLPKLHNGHKYFTSTDTAHKSLFIFLHGGVNNPVFKSKSSSVDALYLIDNNEAFMNQVKQFHLDLVMPVTDDSMNWVENPEKVFSELMSFIASSGKLYTSIYIGGFSDGGTGSYKLFYLHPNVFKGLLVLNGFPQHKNFNKSIDYTAVTNKHVVFAGTFKDKRIPYEFLMTEYCAQKKSNPNTYLYLTKGKHSMHHLSNETIQELLDLLTGKSNNVTTEVVHGYVKEDKLLCFYKYRKSIVRKYNWGADIYMENRRQRKRFR